MVWRVVSPMGYGSKENGNNGFQSDTNKEAGTEHNVIVIDDIRCEEVAVNVGGFNSKPCL